MKKLMLVFMGFIMIFPVFARNFEYTYEGQTLTYTVISEEDRTCMTKEGDGWNPGNNVSGNLIVPNVVLDGDTEYSVTEIGNYAFNNCKGLVSVTIPTSVSVIGEWAFCDCIDLSSIIIPTSVTEFRDCVFYGCSSLVSIAIPDSVSKIGERAFLECDNLKEISVGEENQNYTSIDGVLFDKNKTELILYPAGKHGDYNIPATVSVIGNWAFHLCSNLTSVTIPNSVTVIGNKAFGYCTSLTSVTIPNSVNIIGDYAFNGCSNLESITIPNSVTEIGSWAFENCIALLSVIVPNSVTTIKENTFFGCSSLTSITIPDSVILIGHDAFSYCSSLLSITIPNSVQLIGSTCFKKCDSLASVTIPDSVTEIAYWAFLGCSSLKSVYYSAKDPIKAHFNIFDSDVYEEATLYIPTEAVEKCKLIDPWRNFTSIKAYDFTGIKDVAPDVEGDVPCEIYSISGVRVADSTDGLSPGIYIVSQGNVVKKIAVNYK